MIWSNSELYGEYAVAVFTFSIVSLFCNRRVCWHCLSLWDYAGTLGYHAECRTNHDGWKIWPYDCVAPSCSVLCRLYPYCKRVILLECRWCIRCGHGFEFVSTAPCCFQSLSTYSGSFCANWGGDKSTSAIPCFPTCAFCSPSLQTSWSDGIARCGVVWEC